MIRVVVRESDYTPLGVDQPVDVRFRTLDIDAPRLERYLESTGPNGVSRKVSDVYVLKDKEPKPEEGKG